MSDHYNAFISYKHAEADIKVAEAIEKGKKLLAQAQE